MPLLFIDEMEKFEFVGMVDETFLILRDVIISGQTVQVIKSSTRRLKFNITCDSAKTF